MEVCIFNGLCYFYPHCFGLSSWNTPCNALGQDWHERMKRIRCTASTPHPIQQRKHCDGAITINTSISLILVEGCHETTCQLAWPWSASFYCIKEICERLWKNLGKYARSHRDTPSGPVAARRFLERIVLHNLVEVHGFMPQCTGWKRAAVKSIICCHWESKTCEDFCAQEPKPYEIPRGYHDQCKKSYPDE